MRRGTLTTFTPSLHARLRSPCLAAGGNSGGRTANSSREEVVIGNRSVTDGVGGGFLSGCTTSSRSTLTTSSSSTLGSKLTEMMSQQVRWQSSGPNQQQQQQQQQSGVPSAKGAQEPVASSTSESESPAPQEELPPVIVEPDVPSGIKNAIDDVYANAQKSGGAMPLGRVLKCQKPTVTHIAGTSLGVKKWIEQYPTKFELYEAANGGTYVLAVKPEAALKRQSMVEYYYVERVKKNESAMAAAAQEQFDQAEVLRKAQRADWEEQQRTVELRKEFVPKFAVAETPRRPPLRPPAAARTGLKVGQNQWIQRGGKWRMRSPSDPRVGHYQDPAQLMSLTAIERKAGELGTQRQDLFDIDVGATVSLGNLSENAVAFHESMARQMEGKRWEQITYLYDNMYRTEGSKQMCNKTQFFSYVKLRTDFFWTSHGLLCLRREGQDRSPILSRDDFDEAHKPKKKKSKTQKEAQGPPPPFPGLPDSPDANDEGSKTDNQNHNRAMDRGSVMSGVAALKAPSSLQTEMLPVLPWRDCGGWGTQFAAPTSEDVYEILKFVPVEWGNLGGLNVSKDIKRRCVRLPSMIEWLRRQPQYFEVRQMMGSTEVRRSVVLHPEAHGLTKEEAKEIVERQLNDLQRQQQDILTGDKKNGSNSRVLTEAAVASGKQIINPAVKPAQVARPNATWRNGQPPAIDLESWTKLLLRVVPSYFIPVISVVRRAPKKGIFRSVDLVDTALNTASHFEVLTVNGASVLRRKTGLDSSSWGAAIKADLQRAGSEGKMDILLLIMSKTTGLWDRTHFLYVRLDDKEKIAVGDFEGMVAFLRSYPSIFKVGEYYFRRVDASDPKRELADVEPQGSGKDLQNKQMLRMLNDNPYANEAHFADVLYYLTPADKPTTLAYLVDCCSPAMKSMIPPRFITLLQQFPRLFKCVEKTPGTFTVEKVVRATSGQPQVTAAAAGRNSTDQAGMQEVADTSNVGSSLSSEEEAELLTFIRPIVAAQTGATMALQALNKQLPSEVRQAIEGNYPDLGTFLTRRFSSIYIVQGGHVYTKP